MIRHLCIFLTVVVIFAATCPAQVGNPLPPIVVNQYERVTTHDELMQDVQLLHSPSVLFQVSIEGKTSQGREIPMISISERHPSTNSPKVTVMVFCAQHGNEPSGKEAALIFVRECAEGKHDDLFKHLNLLLLPTMNPDGNEAATRVNGNKADLNRSHLTLVQPESRALHDVFERFRPEVTLDVHEFGTGGREWERAEYVCNMKEFASLLQPGKEYPVYRIF
jgi:murein tripeptide amidase MpaA